VDGIRYPDHHERKGRDEEEADGARSKRRAFGREARLGEENDAENETRSGREEGGSRRDVSFFFTHPGTSRDKTRAGGERRNRSVAREPKPRAEGERD